MAKFELNSIAFDSKTEAKLKREELEHSKNGDIDEYKLSLEFDGEVMPKPYSLTWEIDQIDMMCFWSSKSGLQHNLTPDWCMRSVESKTASGMPLAVVYNKANQNRVSIALSDPATPTTISVGVVEENAKLRIRVEFFSKPTSKMSTYEVVIRVDNRKITVVDAIESVRDWWTSLGYAPAYVPEGARDPLYSAWYSFHQRTIPDEIVAECEVAKEYGMDTLIVDDGWQTDDNSRGYGYCGDWEICESKIPDMQDFVDRIHALGMKFMVWFSVPFVGIHSKNYKRFEGKYLYTSKNSSASVLDPRFKEVREFLVGIYVDYVKKYGWDGLKLDFIDKFALTDESSTDYDKMDCVSLEEGVSRLLSEASSSLKAINPDFLIEFRQSYVGPAISQYGNMLRVTDCPNDAINNRVGSIHVRLTSKNVPVHSDMLMWSKNDTNESVAHQLLAIMFSVPQISVKFGDITDEHKRVLKAFLTFWREHRATILDGKLEAFGLDANVTSARATSDSECVCVQYQSNVSKVGGVPTYIFNSTGEGELYLDLAEKKKYEKYDIFGNLYETGKLKKGAHKIALENCEMIKVF